MTQTLIPAVQALNEALAAAELIETTGGRPSVLTGSRTATYGPLIKIDAEHRQGDPTGPAYAVRWATYCAPEDAPRVLDRILAQGRAVHAVTAVRSALGGTTTR